MAKVLVVDDDPDFVKVTSKVLEKAGYEVVSAANGAKALQVMRQETPDLVLLDIMMSYILDGLDVSREMAEDPALKDIIRQDMALGKTLKVRGVPALFINGKGVKNRSLTALSSMVEEELDTLQEKETDKN